MAKTDKPNILVIWGDDIGIANLSCYSRGLMGYQTPNIDRLAREGMMFTDSYGEQSCTAGRSSFITGQSCYRTGLSKVGIPAAPQGMRAEDPTIAELLKPHGYVTAQFGKNHLGDRNEFLPTVHGFDEFYGNLYHLNAEEEPEMKDYPPEADFPEFRKQYGPRGVLRCKATDKDDATNDPRFGRVGKQTIEDTGPLDRKRMETCDDDFAAGAIDFMKRANDSGKPFFLWLNFTHMHCFTHTQPESVGQAGRWQSPYHDTMIDHDKNVGDVLRELDELGIADNTFVMYSTDNGPYMNSWPDAGMTPFRSEKNTNWEGAYRVPCLVRWLGKIKGGVVSNEIVQHHDWMQTFLAMAGEPDIEAKLKKGHKAGDKTFKVHLDGFNLLPYLTGREPKSPRKGFVYFNDDGDIVALRYDNWKVVFSEQRVQGTLRIWAEPFVPLRVPKLFNLRTDPYERADITSNSYYDWFLHRGYLFMAASVILVPFLQSFKEFPPRQKPARDPERRASRRTRPARVRTVDDHGGCDRAGRGDHSPPSRDGGAACAVRSCVLFARDLPRRPDRRPRDPRVARGGIPAVSWMAAAFDINESYLASRALDEMPTSSAIHGSYMKRAIAFLRWGGRLARASFIE
jgi:arylsulfatase A-like enzyme